MKILIIKTSALGDIAQSFLALHWIREHFPKAQIDWVVEKAGKGLVSSHPHVSHTLCLDTKSWRKKLFKKETRKEIRQFIKKLRKTKYDVVFDLQSNTKSGLVTFFAKSKKKAGFSLKYVSEFPNILFTNKRYHPPKGLNKRLDYLFPIQQFFNKDKDFSWTSVKLKISVKEKEKVEKIIKKATQKDKVKIAVFPGSNWENKQLCPETLKGFLDKLNDFLPSTFLLMWGMDRERILCEELHKLDTNSIIVNKLSFPALQYFISNMDLVVAMDSFPLHLCGTTDTPSFSIFGPSLGEKYKPLGSTHFCMQGKCPNDRSFDTRCKLMRSCPTNGCMKHISADDVFEQFKAWWQQ